MGPINRKATWGVTELGSTANSTESSLVATIEGSEIRQSWFQVLASPDIGRVIGQAA